MHGHTHTQSRIRTRIYNTLIRNTHAGLICTHAGTTAHTGGRKHTDSRIMRTYTHIYCSSDDNTFLFQLHMAAGSNIRSSPKALYNNITIDELQTIAGSVSTRILTFI